MYSSAWRPACLVFGVLTALGACDVRESPSEQRKLQLASLSELSIVSLRGREYGSEPKIEKRLAPGRSAPTDTSHPQATGSYMASYLSDGLRVYSRIDVPASPAPVEGYPVIVIAHGWVGVENAPDYGFATDSDSMQARVTDAYVNAGFVVVTPGFRGHGTVAGIAAEGIDYLAAWDNGSYLSPVFYAIDVLNLVEGLHSFEAPAAWGEFEPEHAIKLDLGRIGIFGHSQGGDVALIALAISGEGSAVENDLYAGSIWSGTFPSRFTQLASYHPMQSARMAFLAGDGSWNGTATGANGEFNPDFVFGYPADWIGTPHPDEWSWQNDTWSLPSVADALEVKLEQMYDAVSSHVTDLADIRYALRTSASGKTVIEHDPRLVAAMRDIGGFGQEAFLREGLVLQHSDRDFYSLPAWNAELCQRINSAGGKCRDFTYHGNTHSLGVSEHAWFSAADAKAGLELAIRRDLALFSGADPQEIH